MDRGGQRSRGGRVHTRHDVVGDQHHLRPRVDPRLEGQKIGGDEGVPAAAVMGDPRVGVLVVAVAGEVLQHAGHPLPVHLLHHCGHILRRLLRVPAETAGIDEVLRVGGDIAHRREVHIDAQAFQQLAFLRGVRPDRLQPTGGVQLLGGGKGFVPIGGVAADTVHGAALLVHADEQGDVRRRLIAPDSLGRLFRRAVFKVPSKEDIAPQVVLGGLFRGTGVWAAGDEHLPHLLLQGHLR